jgi:hypothetical protein
VPGYAKLGIGFVGLIAVACGLFVARSRLTATPVPAVSQPVPVTAAEVQRQDVPIVLEGVGQYRRCIRRRSALRSQVRSRRSLSPRERR